MTPTIGVLIGYLFVLAALIESFVRESALGMPPRLAVAGAGALLVAWLFAAVGRARRRPAHTGWLDAPAPTGPAAVRDSG